MYYISTSENSIGLQVLSQQNTTEVSVCKTGLF